MRKQTRPPEPQVLRDNAVHWNADWAAKVAANPGTSFYWHEHRRQSVRGLILPVLREMNQGHCSFCDCYPLEDRSKEPIEHFKPKKRYPEVAFTWANLYYTCEFCQGAKREKWDDSLLRPDDPDYSCDRYFDFDHTNGAMRANPAAEAPDQRRADVTIALYDLDNPARRRQRRLALEDRRENPGKNIDLCSYRSYIEAETA